MTFGPGFRAGTLAKARRFALAQRSTSRAAAAFKRLRRVVCMVCLAMDAE
jgi:hypothetical protein